MASSPPMAGECALAELGARRRLLAARDGEPSPPRGAARHSGARTLPCATRSLRCRPTKTTNSDSRLHQIRSLPSPVPARPSGLFASPLVLVNGRVAGSNRASVPARHAWHGRNVVAVSGHGRQTGRLVTGHPWVARIVRAPDSSSGALSSSSMTLASPAFGSTPAGNPNLPLCEPRAAGHRPDHPPGRPAHQSRPPMASDRRPWA
jgi:hypothetical protein